MLVKQGPYLLVDPNCLQKILKAAKAVTYLIRETTVCANGSVMTKIHLKREYSDGFITNHVMKKVAIGDLPLKLFDPMLISSFSLLYDPY